MDCVDVNDRLWPTICCSDSRYSFHCRSFQINISRISHLPLVYLLPHIPEMFLTSDLLWEYWIELVAIEPHCISITLSARYSEECRRFCEWLPLWCLMPWNSSVLQSNVGPPLCEAILSEPFSFSPIAFKLILEFCTSISHRRYPHSFLHRQNHHQCWRGVQ